MQTLTESPSTLDAWLTLAIQEDLAGGDITTDALISPDATSRAQVVCRQSAVISGIDAALRAMNRIAPQVIVTSYEQDGNAIAPKTILMTLDGPTAQILKAERLALNLIQHLSGISTLTFQYVGAVSGTSAKIAHTRKTIPGLRELAIQAVLHGGGIEHRASLASAILVKDNHLQAIGGIPAAVTRLRQVYGNAVAIQVECDTLAQVREAVDADVSAILLDNMPLETLRQAVALGRGRIRMEASGGVTLRTVSGIAATGVDVISTSQITLSAPAVDVGLDFLD